MLRRIKAHLGYYAFAGQGKIRGIMEYGQVHKKTYLITGITGLIGRMLAEELILSAAEGREEIQIIGVGRNRERMQDTFAGVNGGDIAFVEADCADNEQVLRRITTPIDHIIHCACPTASAYMISNPVETADSIVLGTRNILELARRLRVKSMVYLSSMEAYGVVKDIGRARTEDELGDIDITSARSCYSLGKRMAEHYCHIYRKEYGVPVRIARLAQVFGRGVRPVDNRVYMQFARAACEGRDIVLKTRGDSMGNYCASDDAVRAILTILNKGEDGEVYNVVNESNTMCIRQMAELVASQIADGKISVRIEPEDAERTGYAPDTGLRLSGAKLRKLGWKPVKGIAEMYREVMDEIDFRKSAGLF